MYTMSKIADLSSNDPTVLKTNGGNEQKIISNPGLLGVYRA